MASLAEQFAAHMAQQEDPEDEKVVLSNPESLANQFRAHFGENNTVEDEEAATTEFIQQPNPDGLLGLVTNSNIFQQYRSGLARGNASFWQTADNVAGLFSAVTGTDKTKLFEELRDESSQWVVDSNSFSDTINQAILQMPAQAFNFVIGQKIGGTAGVAAAGALTHAHEGPAGAIKGAATFALFNQFLNASRKMPIFERMSFGGMFFGGMGVVGSGGDREPSEIAADFALGMTLSAIGGRGDANYSAFSPLRQRIVESKSYRKYLDKRATKRLDEAANMSEAQNLGMNFLREEFPEIHRQIAAAGIGKVRVQFGREVDIIAQNNASLTKALKLSADEAGKLTIRQKAAMLLDSVDVRKELSPSVRTSLLDNYLTTIHKAREMSRAASEQRAPRTIPETPAKTGSDVAAVHKAVEKSLVDERRMQTKLTRGLRDKIAVATLDASAHLRRDILREGGEAGKRAMMMFDLSQGASVRGQRVFEKFESDIYGGLGKEQKADLNTLIRMRRIVQIDRLHGEGKIKHEGNITGSQALGVIEKQELSRGRKLTGNEFTELQFRAEKYFGATADLLNVRRKAGLINETLFNKLNSHDYAETRLIDLIDPATSYTVGGKTISVRDSGINEFARGATRSVQMDSAQLLQQLAVRTYNQVARNEANLSLLALARRGDTPTIVRTPDLEALAEFRVKGKDPHIPAGFIQIKAMENGSATPIFLNAKYFDQWVSSNPVLSRDMARFMRVGSGSAFLRPLATGYNPEFVLANFPRDLVHIWLTTGEYSKLSPIYGLQMMKDLAATAKDTATRRGRYENYINEGGGMNFLTHQGRDAFAGERVFDTSSPAWRKTKATLSYLNESSEIWLRLALRERAMRNGKSATEATWTARNYLDFAQGGTLVKGLDNVYPYLNASTQALRGLGRAAKEDFTGTSFKVGQLMAASGWLAHAAIQEHPETWAQIDSRTKQSNFIIPLGFHVVDPSGNKRWAYSVLKKDNNVVPFTSVAEALVERHMTGVMPELNVFDLARDSLPIVGGSIPIMDAFATYRSNHDFWFDDRVWRGAQVLPRDEYLAFPNKPTPAGFRELGQATDLSPVRLERSFGKLAPTNAYTGFVGETFNRWFRDPEVDEWLREQSYEQVLFNKPFIRRAVKLTHPAAVEMDELETVRLGDNSRRLNVNREMDALISRYQSGETSKADMFQFIQNQDPVLQTSLLNRTNKTIKYQKVLERFSMDGLPTRAWWVVASDLLPDQRAAEFHRKQEALDDPAKVQAMEKIAGQLPGWHDRNFIAHLGRERQLYGSRVREFETSPSDRNDPKTLEQRLLPQ